MFDGHFIKPLLENGKEWEHERASEDMIEHIIKTHGLEPAFLERGLEYPKHVDFIKTLISGSPRLDGFKSFLVRPRITQTLTARVRIVV